MSQGSNWTWARRVGLLLGIAVLGTAVGVVATAHPGPVTSGVIHSCVNNSSGTIHIISAIELCSANELSVDWNAVGPAGPPGAQGPPGISGIEYIEGPPSPPLVPGGGPQTSQANCSAGKKVLGGGYHRYANPAGPTSYGVSIIDSVPVTPASGFPGYAWAVTAEQAPNIPGQAPGHQFRAWAICATA